MSYSSKGQTGQDLEIQPGDRVTLRKPHPCGSSDWEVVRIGADVGLRCLGCGRTVMLPRHEFRTKLRHVLRSPDG